MKSLTDIGLETGTDKATYHGYTRHYETHFGHLRDKEVNLLEIGVASGASMRMWDQYFAHPQTKITGIDIVEPTPFESSYRTHVVIGDGTREVIPSDYDIIIDDGSHVADDIATSFELWWPYLVPGGWYVIEDLAVQWRRDYGGGASGSFITNTMIGYLNGLMHGGVDTLPISEMHVYDEIVFLRKK